MTAFFIKIFSFFAAAIMAFGAGEKQTSPHTVLDEDDCRLCISVISDSHIETTNPMRYRVFRQILADVKNNSFGCDAAVFLGDNTMNGQVLESAMFYGSVANADVSDNIISVCGNHDVGNGEGDYDKLLTRFLNYNNSELGLGISKPYYYKVINGYYFIVLGPEDLCVYECPISEEQYKFLEDTLKIATKSGKPVFICAHHPYDDIGDDWGERIEEIVAPYDNIFFLSGHTHMPIIDGWTFYEGEYLNEVNLPRCTSLLGEDDSEVYSGTGWTVQLEIYDDEVVGRARNSWTGEWDDEMEYHFKLK